jgi:aspartate carbamoyltransferase catalytic subunit
VLISPDELKLPSYIKKDVLVKQGIEYVQTDSLEAVLPELDVLYMTRVQKERFLSEEEYIRLRDSYILTREKLVKNAKGLGLQMNELIEAIRKGWEENE